MGSVDPYELFISTWTIKAGNEFHKDFDIYSSYEDAVEDRDPWMFCNGDDKGVGFPRDCGHSKKTVWKWFAFPKTTPAPVDFHARFTPLYVRSKCYHKATFEILEKVLESSDGSEVSSGSQHHHHPHHHHHHHPHHNIQHCSCA